MCIFGHVAFNRYHDILIRNTSKEMRKRCRIDENYLTPAWYVIPAIASENSSENIHHTREAGSRLLAMRLGYIGYKQRAKLTEIMSYFLFWNCA